MAKQGFARTVVACLAFACSIEVNCASSSEVSTAAFPEAERVMGQARSPHADPRGGFTLDTHRNTMTAHVDGSAAIDVDTLGSHARIERIGFTGGRARLEANVVRTGERFLFARGEEVEELDLLTAPVPLAYRFAVAAGFGLHALSPTMVQVDDDAGQPWLRMRADRAWGDDGREVRISLAVDGDTVRVVVPEDAPYPLLVDPIWAAASSPTVVRTLHTATLLGDGRVLIAGGYDFATANTAEIYDPRTGLFTAVAATMKAHRNRHVAIMLPSGKVALVGGLIPTPQIPAAEIFDPEKGTFTASTGNSAMGGEINLAALLPDGKVLLEGYATNTIGAAKAAEIFDPATGSFTSATAGSLEPLGTMVHLADGRIFHVSDCGGEIYDPSTTNWTAAPDTHSYCSQPESRGAAVMHDGRVLVTAGISCSGGGFCTTEEIFDPSDLSWTFVASPGQPGDGRSAQATLLPSGKVVVTGGQGFSTTTNASIYDPTGDTFGPDGTTVGAHHSSTATMLPGGDVLLVGGDQTAADIRTFAGSVTPTTGNMTTPRYAAATQRLKDGKVLIAGGSTHPTDTAGSSLSSAELYDPTAQTFSATTGALSTPREYAIAALLPSGKVLIAGGDEVGTDTPKATAEVYDPSSKSFTAVGSMTVARTRHAAARLPNGKILVTGGCADVSHCLQTLDAGSSRLKSAEIFDPSTETFTATTNPMAVARSEHGMVVMSDGRVLVVGTQGQSEGINEVYDPTKGFFSIVSTLFSSGFPLGRSALRLSSGNVFVATAFGTANLIGDATVANPTWTSVSGIGFNVFAAQYMPTLGGDQVVFVGGVKAAGNGIEDSTVAESRVAILQTLVTQNGATVVTDLGAGSGRRDVATSVVDRGILVAGGDSGFGGTLGSVTNTAYVYSDGAPDALRPQLTSGPTTIAGGTVAQLNGLRLTTLDGDTPVAFWQPAGSNTFVRTRITSFTATTAQWTAPITALHGLGWLHVETNGVASNSLLVEVTAAENGSSCKATAECKSAFCIEGVCCDTQCGDGAACLSCTARRKGSGADGTCGSVTAGADPDNKCFLDNGSACSATKACKSGFCVAGVCCNESCTGSCRTCMSGTCQETASCGDAAPPLAGPTCDGDHRIKEDGKPDIDCTPYKCNGSACRTDCASANDCVEPTVCSYSGQCIPPPVVKPASESLFGCTASSRPASSTAALGLILALMAAGALRRKRGAVVVLGLLLVARSASAQTGTETDDQKKVQARAFFESGLGHFDKGEMSAALADFLRSRELFPTRTATINAAICLRKEGRAEQALELDEDVLRTYPDLEGKDRAFVENEIAQLRPVVGSIDFVAGEPGAAIVIDGRERGTFPPPAPIRVASGVHVVRVYKAGFVQLERRIEIAGRQLLQFDAKLSPLLASGRLVVTEASAKVLTVVVDNVEVGKTPYEGTLPVGRHVVALRGPDDLGTAPVDAVIQENQSTPLGLAAETLDSALRITPTPAGALVSIDGVIVGHGVWEGKLRSGAHTVEVAEDGFLAQKRVETLTKGERSAVTFALERDVTSSTFQRKNPARVSVEIDGGPGLGLLFGGDVRDACSGSCSAQVPIGLGATLRGAYTLGWGLSFGIDAGVLALAAGTTGRQGDLTPNNLSPNTGTVDDALYLRGFRVGPSVGYRLGVLGDDLPITLRVGLGVFLGSVGDGRTGSFTSSKGARYDVSVSESATATYLYAAPEVRIGKKLGDHLELNAGVTVLVLAALERPQWSDQQPVLAGNDGLAKFGSQPTAGSFLLAAVPGIGARYAF